MSSSPFVNTLQATIDYLSKKREEMSHHKGGEHEVSDRLGNIERTLSHVLTRLDRMEDLLLMRRSSDKSGSSSAPGTDEFLASTERMLREILVEFLKQQSVVDKYRQENDTQKEKSPPAQQQPQQSQQPQSQQPQSQQPQQPQTQQQQQQPSQQKRESLSSSAPSPSSAAKSSVPHATPDQPAEPKRSSLKSSTSPPTQPTVIRSSSPSAASPPTLKKNATPKKPLSPKSKPSRPFLAQSDEDEAEAEPASDGTNSSHSHTNSVLKPAIFLPVEYPPGYNPNRGRRFSVAGESYNPNTDFSNVERKIIKKSEEVKKRIRNVITNNILFKNLEEEPVEDLIDEMFEVRLRPDEVIIRQGDDGDNFYVVDSGELYVLYKDVVVATIGSGKSFGEIALMYNCPRTATVKAKSDCILWGMSRNTFRRSLMVHAIRKRQLYESFLAKVPLLETLLPYERSIIADALEPKSYQDGEYIIRQGEKGDCFYIIEKGTVTITKGDLEVKQSSVGDYFGELALLTDQPRAANVKALGMVRVLCLNRSDFANLMGPCEEILKRNMKLYEQVEAQLHDRATMISNFSMDEQYYLHLLAATVQDFLVPMRKAAESGQLVVPPEDVAQLFSNVEMLLNIHTTFNNDVSQLNGQSSPSLIGKMFLKLSPALKFYYIYCGNFKTAHNMYDKCRANEAIFSFLKPREAKAQHDLLQLLRNPTERVAKYLFFLKDLQAVSVPDKEVTEAIHKLTAINEEVHRVLNS